MRVDKLRKMNACQIALNWTAKQRSMDSAYGKCDNGSWLLWLAKKVKVDDRLIAMACYRIADIIYEITKEDYELRWALSNLKMYAEGERSENQLVSVKKRIADYLFESNGKNVIYVNAVLNALHLHDLLVYYVAKSFTTYLDILDDYSEDGCKIVDFVYKRSADICREVFGDELPDKYRKYKS